MYGPHTLDAYIQVGSGWGQQGLVKLMAAGARRVTA